MDLRIERKGYNIAVLEWDVAGKVALYKQNNAADEPVKLCETTAGIYIDEDNHLYSNNPEYFIEKDGIYSPKRRMDNLGDNYQYAIADNYQWQLRYLPRGFQVKAYLKAESDNYCPECYNTILKKQVKTVCNTCDGSGMLNSIKGPVSIYMGIMQRKKEKVYDEMKEREEETISAWTGNYPYLKQGDIIRFNGLLYVVQYIPNYVYSPSQSNNEPFMVRQEFILVRLDKNNQFYSKLKDK